MEKAKKSLYRPEKALRAIMIMRLLQFLDNQHMKVIRLSALRTGSL